MVIKGITRRWLFNGMGVIFAILAVMWVFFAIAVRSYFYNSVMQSVISIARTNSNNFSLLLKSQSSDYYSLAKRSVETFFDKDKMELVMLNRNGTVLITSSGFMPVDLTPTTDFKNAVEASNGIGEWDGYSAETGEKIMAVTSILYSSDGTKIGAARYVVSLSKVDMQIATFILISGLICVTIMLFGIMSGTYFVNSIVVPIREIGSTARRIASGDLEARIGKKYDDEIGELCDTLNFMAGELDAAERMKNDFISSVSHELRTPLTAIRGWGETILSSGPSDRETLAKGMGVIIEETERLSTMVEELLDFSRIQSRRFKLIPDKLDIVAELGEAVLMFSDRAKREGVSLVFNEPESLPPVMADKDKLKQVFVNIVDNALKYSDPGGTVTVNAAQQESNLVVTIGDTGCGISQTDLPHVKEKFYKGTSTRRGTGIGLAVCEEIVNMHGGHLDINSRPGEGTKVSIILPIYLG
ncbi:MAG: HAMP domain-containing sensor histidine kinase [Clostridia bacterium]|nr:HAMP domain-containing sensor histidine kinase [Clostridia bacterium]